jgi:hypothetical protein
MPTKVAEAETSSAEEAVDEAIRTVSGMPYRGTEQVKHVIATSSSLMSEQFATGRHLFQAWSEGVQTMLKASFEAQNAMVATAPALLEAAYNANKTVVDRIPHVMHQYQKAVLMAVQESTASTDKLFTRPAKESPAHH